MRARIYQHPKSAMQSGHAGTQEWRLDYAPTVHRQADPLMGWSGGTETQTQVTLHFDTREAAVGYAERHGIAYDLELPPPRRIRPKAYADNFRFGRVENWTH